MREWVCNLSIKGNTMAKDNYKQKPMNVFEMFIIRLSMVEGKSVSRKTCQYKFPILWEQDNKEQKKLQTQDKNSNNYDFTTYRYT